MRQLFEECVVLGLAHHLCRGFPGLLFFQVKVVEVVVVARTDVSPPFAAGDAFHTGDVCCR